MEGPKPETNKEVILSKINQKLAGLGSTMKWHRPPEFFPEYETLSGKTILMVDDTQGVIEAYVPSLVRQRSREA